MPKAKKKVWYEVQTHCLFGGWLNVWTETVNGRTRPWVFTTRKAAQRAIDEYEIDVKEAIKDGDMDKDSWNPDELRIVRCYSK